MHHLAAASLDRVKRALAAGKGQFVAVAPRDFEVLKGAAAGDDYRDPVWPADRREVALQRGVLDDLVAAVESRQAAEAERQREARRQPPQPDDDFGADCGEGE